MRLWSGRWRKAECFIVQVEKGKLNTESQVKELRFGRAHQKVTVRTSPGRGTGMKVVPLEHHVWQENLKGSGASHSRFLSELVQLRVENVWREKIELKRA